MKCSKGFSLFELLIVLAIIAFAAALAPPFLTSARAGFETRAFAQEIADKARLARSEAVIERRTVVMTFDPPGGRYRSEVDPEWTALPKRVALSFEPAGDSLDEIYPIAYYADGSSSGGTVIVSTAKRAWRVRATFNGKVEIEKISP